MKLKVFGALLLLVFILGGTNVVAQQRTTKKRTTTPKKKAPQSAYTQNNSNNQSQYTSSYNNPGADTTPRIGTNIPIVVIPPSGNIGIDSITPSLRNDAAIERNLIKDRQPLAYEHIREDDAVYRQRVWEEIDTREKINLPFNYSADEDNGNQRFIAILINAIKNREVTAFDPIDDRFTTPMTPEKVLEAFSGGVDTVPVVNMQGDIERYEVRPREFNPDSIYTYRIKEEWVFDKESSRMFVRILGIAPVKPIYTSTGLFIGMLPMFWVYYPDLRPTLARYEAFNGKNYGARMSWEELFENRMFSSYVIKATLDNPFDRRLKDYIRDPILRLLEGENIKEKIFDYEQDLWSY